MSAHYNGIKTSARLVIAAHMTNMSSNFRLSDKGNAPCNVLKFFTVTIALKI